MYQDKVSKKKKDKVSKANHEVLSHTISSVVIMSFASAWKAKIGLGWESTSMRFKTIMKKGQF